VDQALELLDPGIEAAAAVADVEVVTAMDAVVAAAGMASLV
jgi:hypothetical protein